MQICYNNNGDYMIKEAIFHKMDKEYAYALSDNKFLIKIKTKKDDILSIKLYYCDKYLRKYKRMEGRLHYKEMKKVFSDELFDYYEGEINIDVICLRYFFKLISRDEISYYGNYRFYNHKITIIDEMFDFSQQVRVEEIFDIPSWAEGSIVYQIFPDRFARTDFDTSGIWYDPPKRFSRSLYGGTIKGITQHLDYLSSLGIEVIYLTPIFTSSSDHKYNTDDYLEIDKDFGTIDDFKELVGECHKRNIKLILDGVFNHSGFMFEPFQDVIKNQENSRYKDWYYIKKFPVDFSFTPDQKWKKPNWLTFGYAGPMPKLNTSNPEVREYIFKVARKYLELGIDGWRLDVADEISHDFWKEFRKVVKSINKDALIIGEVWYESTPWLLGDEYDTVMNYEFSRDIGLLVNDKTYKCSDFVNDYSFLLGRVHKAVRNYLWNLIDSHDTPRFLTSSGSKKKLKFALSLQMVLPGMPMIYYGDELGMEGKQDPDCRRGMLWDENKQDKEMLEHYKKWINIRKNVKALRKGTTKFVNINDELKTFEVIREYKKEIVRVLVDVKKYEVKIID